MPSILDTPQTTAEGRLAARVAALEQQIRNVQSKRYMNILKFSLATNGVAGVDDTFNFTFGGGPAFILVSGNVTNSTGTTALAGGLVKLNGTQVGSVWSNTPPSLPSPTNTDFTSIAASLFNGGTNALVLSKNLTTYPATQDAFVQGVILQWPL